MNPVIQHYKAVRNLTETIFGPPAIEDYIPQPVEFVSPPKWNLVHTSWFFGTFILKAFQKNDKPFNSSYAFLFNSYYNNAGPRILLNQQTAKRVISSPWKKVLMKSATVGTGFAMTMNWGLRKGKHG